MYRDVAAMLTFSLSASLGPLCSVPSSPVVPSHIPSTLPTPSPSCATPTKQLPGVAWLSARSPHYTTLRWHDVEPTTVEHKWTYMYVQWNHSIVGLKECSDKWSVVIYEVP